MFLNRLRASLRLLFGRRRIFALCPARVRFSHLAIMVVSMLLLARTAAASVLATGDYSPADNPFTTSVNEGIPTDGNFVNPFELPGTGGVVYQTFFEGRHSDGANTADPADDTNINFNVFVGRTSSGSLLISGESALRDQDLVIGDTGTLNGQTRVGPGVVRITGFGSLYNNDPNILPAEVQAAIAAGLNFHSVNPRSTTTGYDVLVGSLGNGTLEI